jgi:hypothetical protein
MNIVLLWLYSEVVRKRLSRKGLNDPSQLHLSIVFN